MKTNVSEFLNNQYLGVSFAELMDVVFTPEGERRRCPRKACKALIIRLERCFPCGGFGNKSTGNINEMDAYVASLMILHKGYNV